MRKPQLLLIHGFCEDGTMFDGFTEEFSQDYEVLTPDLPGYGKRLDETAMPTLKGYAQWLLENIVSAETENLHVIGHSMGGYIAMEMISLNSNIKSIGLWHSHVFGDNPEKRALREKAIAFIEKNGTKRFLKDMFSGMFADANRLRCKAIIKEITEKAGDLHDETVIQGYRAMMNRPDHSETLEQFKGRILIIAGEEDPSSTLEMNLKQALIPNQCNFHLLSNTGHFGMYESDNQCRKALSVFLNLC